MRISQREARRLRKRVHELENAESHRRRAWGQQWPGGVQIASCKWDDSHGYVPVAVRTARKMGHAVIAMGDDGGEIRFIALPHPNAGI